MANTPFIWLGAGRAGKRGVVRRGRYLDDVARARLPVPDGAILLDELFRIFLREGVIELIGEKVVVPDPIWLLEVLYRDVRLPRLRKTADFSMIPVDDYEGPLPPEAVALGSDLEDPDQVAHALSKVWSYPKANADFRRDVSLVTRVGEQTVGRAISFSHGEDVVYNFSSAADGGERETFSLPRLGGWQRPFSNIAPYARRLQLLLRGLRRTLNDEEDFDFYWADDGEVCWIKLFN